jgi:hypothetical protein
VSGQKNFSQRKGIEPVPELIQVNGMSDALRNSLWNVLDVAVWSGKDFVWAQYGNPRILGFSSFLWVDYFKRPRDERPGDGSAILAAVRKHFFASPWNKAYEFIEFVVEALKDSHRHLAKHLNFVLERELSGYRIIDCLVVDITDEQEIKMLSETLSDSRFAGPTAHLRRALELLANREAPDHRNSIKESISAVESMARLVTGNDKATLADALKVLERNRTLHTALKEGFSKLYGYTSDEGGIRHSMLDEPNLSAADSRYFLLSCTSFVNYLKAQL